MATNEANASGEAPIPIDDDDGAAAEVVKFAQCLGCGYSLSGLVSGGQCPECGLDLEASIHGDRLEIAPRDYVRRVARGAWRINAGLGAVVVLIILIIATAVTLGILAGAVGGPSSVDVTIVGVLLAVFMLGLLAAYGVVLWGWISFTAPNPLWKAASDSAEGRQMSRISLIVVPLAYAMGFGIEMASYSVPMPSVAAAMSIASTLLPLSAWAFHGWAAMSYTRYIGQRLGDAKLTRRAGRNRIACPIWSTVGFLLCGLGPLISLILYYNTIVTARKSLASLVKRVEMTDGADTGLNGPAPRG